MRVEEGERVRIGEHRLKRGAKRDYHHAHTQRRGAHSVNVPSIL